VFVDIAQMSLRKLRTAIHNNEISFPSQVPIFLCQPRADIQWRLVELYFVHNWSCQDLGQRYGVAMERIRQLLAHWVRRAVALGYLQTIPLLETNANQAVGHEPQLIPLLMVNPPPSRVVATTNTTPASL
jgi:hypothetical protein